jgi:diguanylate cyclase (GGDEF)-like protein
MLGYLQWIWGTEKFFGLPRSSGKLAGMVAAAVAVCTWFLLVQPNFEMRTLAVSGTLIVLNLVHCQRLASGHDLEAAGRFLLFALAGSALCTLARVTAVWAGLMGSELFDSNQLNAAINAAQALFSLLSLLAFVLIASERVREEFERLATKDSLTGALMRGTWQTLSQAEVDRSRRHARPLSLVAMDLDHFKQINDSLVHAAGDQALIDFVQRAGAHLRSQDLLGRLGGEEFVLLLPETGLEDASTVAERIRLATERSTSTPRFTVSIGVATLQTEETSISALLSRADAAMYRAKKQGRNRVELAQAAPVGAQATLSH